jgi:hypothetical protein
MWGGAMSSDPYDKIERELHTIASSTLSYTRATALGDSEIERLFYTALRSFLHSGSGKNIIGIRVATDISHLDQLMAEEGSEYSLLLLPQAQIAGWRTDFLICATPLGKTLGVRSSWSATATISTSGRRSKLRRTAVATATPKWLGCTS